MIQLPLPLGGADGANHLSRMGTAVVAADSAGDWRNRPNSDFTALCIDPQNAVTIRTIVGS